MADPRPEYVVKFQRRGLFITLFVLAALATLWVPFVLFGESQDWGDDPGRWTGLPTFYWALLAVALDGLFIVYGLAALVIRERPGRVYQFQASNDAPPAAPPSFLQPATPEAAAPSAGTPPPGQP